MTDGKKKVQSKGSPRTVYLPEYLWMRLVSLADKLGISVSRLIVRFCLQGLKQKIPNEEFEKLQIEHKIHENIERLDTLTRWGNELRKSGVYALKTYNELVQGVSPDFKKRIALPAIASPEELEATRRLFQHRNSLALETSKLILEELPDLQTFNMGLTDSGKYKPYKNTITPETIATALINSLNSSSEMPFMDWVKQQKQATFYDFQDFKDVAEFFDRLPKRKRKDESKT
jgi:hypothetical protein